ncbi:4'-phosphopantetheinyl transferase superfamily protein [Rhizobium sp. FY34]|uniref:4'-phosphopantetheinyl transferase family protein n=1 Tax=Rhizobium sp. FY34 TaxID=2562309 RepID=UPI001FEE11B9|nr:4'-phosphopantetheinyl transferase superfamily protein [Rhizobium sp. FY34]
MFNKCEAGADIVVAIPVLDILAVYDPAAFLNEAEQAQAQRFHQLEDSLRFQAAHVLKRILIGAVVGKATADLHFARAAGGKPFLLNAGPLDFNLSHGGDWVAVALSWTGRIGVDVESEREDDFWQEISSAIMAPMDVKNIGFLKRWTAKEAAIKANGAGLAIPLTEVVIDTTDSETFVAALPTERLSGTWRQLDAAHVLATVTDGNMVEICVCNSVSILKRILDLS